MELEGIRLKKWSFELYTGGNVFDRSLNYLTTLAQLYPLCSIEW